MSTPSCGQVCEVVAPDATGLVTKYFNCSSIFLRMKFPDGELFKPPLRRPPEVLLQQYLQNGTMIQKHGKYFDNSNSDNRTKIFKRSNIRQIMIQAPVAVGYGRGGYLLWHLLRKYRTQMRGKAGVVIGTQNPWIEVLLLRNGAANVTTVDYQPMELRYPGLHFVSVDQLADLYLQGHQPRFDFAVSFSSMEHSGLGRYGDPLNPWADMEAAAQVWCLLREGGLFFLGLPGSDHPVGELHFNGRRSYGEGRWQQMAANFDSLEWRKRSFDRYLHDVCVLKKRAPF